MKKIAGSLVFFTCITLGQVHFEYSGTLVSDGTWPDSSIAPRQNVFNSTSNQWWVVGSRFYTKDIKWSVLEGQKTVDPRFNVPLLQINETKDGFSHEIKFERPDQFLVAPTGATAFKSAQINFGWTAGSKVGLDGKPFNKSVQLKLFERGTPPLAPSGHAPIAVSDIKSYISGNKNYYNSAYRYLDTMGIRGGEFSGGFYDTYGDETQLNLAMTGDTFELSNSKVVFSPQTSSGPIYWMSLGMMQEYFSEDMQFQMSIGFKETMAGLASDASSPIPYLAGKCSNTDGAFGPFEVEGPTYVSQAMYYAYLFPQYRQILTKSQTETEVGVLAFNDASLLGSNKFASVYCGPYTAEGTKLNSPYVIGCMIGSYGTFQRIYDILANANKLCFKEMLRDGADKWIGVAALAVLYNRGISQPDSISHFTADSAFDISVYRKIIKDPHARERLPMGNSLYREHVLSLINTVASWNVKAYNDPKIPIYDEKITLNDLKLFFFGENGDASKQGGGGLCSHFEVADRAALWNDIQKSFAELSAHWGGSSISYRYDWLTMLRSVKQYFPIKRPLRPTTSEAARWVSNTSVEAGVIQRDLKEGSCGCDSIIVDKTAPYTSIQGVKTGGVTVVQLNGKDSIAGVKDLIWTADKSWDNWNTGTFSSGTAFNGSWIAEIPSSVAAANATVWVGLVDSSGNADIREIVLKDVGTVGVAEIADFAIKGFSVAMAGNTLLLNSVPAGSVSLKLFDLRGRELFKLHGESLAGTARFTLPEVASGSYLLTIKTATQDRTIRIVR